MTPTSIATSARRPNRLLVILAAAWMIVSLTIGGQLTDTARADTAAATNVSTTASRP